MTNLLIEATINAMALISNKKAYFNYSIIQTYTAGMELFGFEVKSLRQSQGSLDGSYVIIRGGEAYLINAFIPPYQKTNINLKEERRSIKLLLHKKEIKELSNVDLKKGVTLIPLSVFEGGKKLKIEIAIAEGKQKFDKRETLKKRDTDREIRRKMKH